MKKTIRYIREDKRIVAIQVSYYLLGFILVYRAVSDAHHIQHFQPMAAPSL